MAAPRCDQRGARRLRALRKVRSMSRTRKIFSFIIALLLIGVGSAVLGNWLFLSGRLPKYAGYGSGMLIVVGVIILWEDISEWWAGR